MNAPRSPDVPEHNVPTCYRHPDRETYVRCTRCDRYICPDCMREAAVGHQCPECVAEGNRSVRQPRTAMGARATAAAKPVVTYWLIGVCVAAYVVSIMSSRFMDELAMIGVWADQGVAHGQWWRLATSTFLHQTPDGGSFGITHILFNMWALYVLGPPLEQALGKSRFLALYLLAGVGGSVLLFVVSPQVAAVGASGSIFGLFAAFFVLSRRTGSPTGPIMILLLINLVITFAVPGISWQGHIGGLITGGIIALAYAYAPLSAQRVVGWAAPVAVFAVMVVAVSVKTLQVTSGVI